MKDPYLILNVRDSHNNEQLVWWRENRSGYTTDVNQAGRYSKEDAEGISYREGDDMYSRGRHDIAVPLSAISSLEISHVISTARRFELVEKYPARNKPRKLVEVAPAVTAREVRKSL